MIQSEKVKILFAGGHAATTAYAVVREIRRRNLDWEIHFAGRKWATEDKKSLTLEYKTLPVVGIKFHTIESGKIQTKFTSHTIPALLKIPFGFFRSMYLLLKIKPKLVLSFGSASGALISFWAFIFGIPVIIHEQTAAIGRGNKFGSMFAKKIMVSRESSKQFFSKGKTVVTGNPINPDILKLKNSQNQEPETILITGGSRGSEKINEIVKDALPELLKKYKVIHQVGEANIDKYKPVDGYTIYGQVEANEMLNLFSEADIVIGRAGANTVSELIVLKKPCILIPIPWSYMNEQTKNAEFARDFGIATIINQSELTKVKLINEIDKVRINYMEIAKGVKGKTSPDVNASKNLVEIMENYL